MNIKEQGFLKNGSVITDKNEKQFCFWYWIMLKGMNNADFMRLSNKKAMIYE